jgi:aryl-phospho-beta-D-glucosidase BglC (GH1 family)
MKNITRFEMVKNMRLGINWGNGFESGSETGWGSPVVGREHYQALWDEGFRTLRIPCSWSFAGGQATEQNGYTINEGYLDRYYEVVKMALDIGFYVIVNTHHDKWVSDVLVGTPEIPLKRIWEQLSEKFRDFDEKLLFETMNEPRNSSGVNGGHEWVADAVSSAKINELNQLAVDVIRASGGNNKYRFILTPSYAAHSYGDAIRDVVMPKDERIIMSLHAYSPFSLCMPNPPGEKQVVEFGSREDIRHLQQLFDNITERFVSKGIPVVMGEWATGNKNNEDARALHAKYYVAFASRIPGIVCIWWDTGSNAYAVSSSVEGHGLFDRHSQPVMKSWYPKIIRGLFEGLEIPCPHW